MIYRSRTVARLMKEYAWLKTNEEYLIAQSRRPLHERDDTFQVSSEIARTFLARINALDSDLRADLSNFSRLLFILHEP